MTAEDGSPDEAADAPAQRGDPLGALTESQRAALQNLARKQAGEDVDWINIADARTLTDLGLAVRSREGWRITEAGLSALRDAGSGAASW